jgi:hypothetical protein
MQAQTLHDVTSLPQDVLALLGISDAQEAERSFVERSEPRRESNWIAMAVLPCGEEIPCTVKDVSKSGAKVGMPERMVLPEAFTLKVLGKDVSCHVRVMWRRGDYAGLRIVGVSRTSADAAAARQAAEAAAAKAASAPLVAAEVVRRESKEAVEAVRPGRDGMSQAFETRPETRRTESRRNVTILDRHRGR